MTHPNEIIILGLFSYGVLVTIKWIEERRANRDKWENSRIAGGKASTGTLPEGLEARMKRYGIGK